MSQDKPTLKERLLGFQEDKGEVQLLHARYVAADGQVFPIFYNGSIIRIDSTTPVEIDPELLSYESSIQFRSAVTKNQIMVTGE